MLNGNSHIEPQTDILPREYITIDQLVSSAPDAIDPSTLSNLKQLYVASQKRAESCEVGKMVDNLLMLGQKIDEIVDEMAFAFRKGKLESAEYDRYIKKLENFQWGTVTKMAKDTLFEKCKCEVR